MKDFGRGRGRDKSWRIEKHRIVKTFDSITACAREYGVERVWLYRIANGYWGNRTFSVDGEKYTVVFPVGKLASNRVKSRHKEYVKKWKNVYCHKNKKGK